MMERSRLLGHCICDVRRPCPCDVFRNDGICPCAGERPDPAELSQVKLTQLGPQRRLRLEDCPADLDAVLGRLPEVNDPAVISGLAAGDDAAIYRIQKTCAWFKPWTCSRHAWMIRVCSDAFARSIVFPTSTRWAASHAGVEHPGVSVRKVAGRGDVSVGWRAPLKFSRRPASRWSAATASRMTKSNWVLRSPD